MLNSNDVFVLSYDITTYVWYGKGCSSLEMKVGDYIATTIVNKSAPMLGKSQFNNSKGSELLRMSAIMRKLCFEQDLHHGTWNFHHNCESGDPKFWPNFSALLKDEFDTLPGIHEGAEPAQFWALLGGKEEYADSITLATAEPIYPARLFHVSNAKGYIAIEEIVDFAQEVSEVVIQVRLQHTVRQNLNDY